jgi:hypothetical protein
MAAVMRCCGAVVMVAMFEAAVELLCPLAHKSARTGDAAAPSG